MSQEAQLGEAGVKVDPSSGIDSILESKNNLIKSLRYDLGKVTKVIIQPEYTPIFAHVGVDSLPVHKQYID
jgi:hypothetical protein